MDLLYNIFTCTDRTLRDSEFDNLLCMYYDQLTSNIRKMGSDADELYSYDDFMDGLRICGNFALLTAPMLLLLSNSVRKMIRLW